MTQAAVGSQPSTRPQFLQAPGEMSARIGKYDWRSTPLGDPDHWPAPLAAATAIMLHSPQPMVIGWGPELNLIYNDGFMRLLRTHHPAALGAPCNVVWANVWDDYGPIVAKALKGIGSSREDMLFRSFRSGEREDAYFSFATSPLFDETGEVAGVLSIVSETTDRVTATRQAREATQALATNEERFRQRAERLFALFEHAPGFVAVLEGPEHIVALTNASYRRLIGHRDIIGLPYRKARPELEGTGAFELLDRVRATGRSVVGVGVGSPDPAPSRGSPRERYVDFIYEPIRDEEGRVQGVFVQGHDVTERVVSERKQRLLINELNHRVMNNLATVQSIAAHTARDAGDLPQFMAAFEGRIIALARTHEALTQSASGGAEVQDLLRRELAEIYPGRVSLAGPALRLDAAKAQALGLIAHELATNAVKYGALSGLDGSVHVTWRIEDAEARFVLEWDETGGPPVQAPRRQGFGSRLIARLTKGEMAGKLEADYRPEGLWVRIVCPLPPAG